MMKWKRMLAATLSTMMLAAVFAGCGGSGDGGAAGGTGDAAIDLNLNGQTITFAYPPSYDMVWYEGCGDPYLEAQHERMQQLGELYNCTIEQIEGRGTYWDLMANTIAAGTPLGHVMVTQENYILGWYKANAIADLSGAMAETGIDFTDARYSQVVRRSTRFDGGQYAFCDVPLNPTGPIWFVNLSLFEREQLGDVYEMIENKEWTWDKVEEIATKATKRAADGTVSQWGLAGNQHYPFLLSLANSNGGGIAGFDDNGDPTLLITDDASMEAFNKMYDWAVTKKIANINDGSKMWDALLKEFTEGNTAILCGSNKMLQIAEESNMEDQIGVVRVPIGPRMADYVQPTDCGQMYFIPVTYQEMTRDLLLLVNELYAPSDVSHSEMIMAKYAKRIGNSEESMNTYVDLVENADRYMLDAVTLTKLDWSSPSVHDLCMSVLSGGKTPGEQVEANKTLMLNNMKDQMKGHKLNFNAD